MEPKYGSKEWSAAYLSGTLPDGWWKAFEAEEKRLAREKRAAEDARLGRANYFRKGDASLNAIVTGLRVEAGKVVSTYSYAMVGNGGLLNNPDYWIGTDESDLPGLGFGKNHVPEFGWRASE